MTETMALGAASLVLAVLAFFSGLMLASLIPIGW